MKYFNSTRNLKSVLFAACIFVAPIAMAQTNVFDDIIATSPNHTYLEAAILQENLEGALQNNMANLTVFAPDDAAFNDLAAALNTDINGLLALPNLSDILLYHVLGVTVNSGAISNGDIVQPLSPTNTLKLTATSGNMVYVNQALVTGADIDADNGTVHVLNKILLPVETVVDVAIDNNFTYLTTAVVTAELLPVLTDPLAKFTVFAPNNQAFDDLAAALNTDIAGLLALPNLADILTYHVLGTEVFAASIANGNLVQPVSTTNNLKMTVTSNSEVFVNQAQVILADVAADNGVVHVLDAVVLPFETVVDVALDNNFTYLAAAVATAELLPALTDPLTKLTVFAPTNQAFDDLAAALNTDIVGLLALPNLGDILLYHVVAGEVFSMDLTNGNVPTLNGASVLVDLSSGVMINDATVTLADVGADNGVVHVINKVLDPSTASLESLNALNVSIYPNPSMDFVTIEMENLESVSVMDMMGNLVLESTDATFNVSQLASGNYIVRAIAQGEVASTMLVVSSK